MVTLVFLCIALPVLPDEGKPRNETFLFGLSTLFGILFSIGAWLSFRIVQRLPDAATTVDEEGLWPSIKGREAGLVKWSDVARLREREFMQRLELEDGTGTVVARLEYQLRDFSRLRAIVLTNAKLERTARPLTGVYQRSMWHHAFTIGAMFGFAGLGWYVGRQQPLVGYGGMALVVGMIAWEYWTTPFRIRLAPRKLEIDRPLRRQIVPVEHVAGIEIEDELINHAKHPKVTIRLVAGAHPIHLKAVGIPAVELHQVLRAWRAGDA